MGDMVKHCSTKQIVNVVSRGPSMYMLRHSDANEWWSAGSCATTASCGALESQCDCSTWSVEPHLPNVRLHLHQCVVASHAVLGRRHVSAAASPWLRPLQFGVFDAENLFAALACARGSAGQQELGSSSSSNSRPVNREHITDHDNNQHKLEAC